MMTGARTHLTHLTYLTHETRVRNRAMRIKQISACLVDAANGFAHAIVCDLAEPGAAAALAASAIERTGQLLSSWELGREYGIGDYDGRRPDWGAVAIDWSVVPKSFVETFRTGTELQLRWLDTLARRTQEFHAKIPGAAVPQPGRTRR